MIKRETDLEKLSSYLENKNEMIAWAQKDPMNISLDTLILGTGHYLCGGGGGGKSWGGPGLFFLEKRGGPKGNFTMIGGGSLSVL